MKSHRILHGALRVFFCLACSCSRLPDSCLLFLDDKLVLPSLSSKCTSRNVRPCTLERRDKGYLHPPTCLKGAGAEESSENVADEVTHRKC